VVDLIYYRQQGLAPIRLIVTYISNSSTLFLIDLSRSKSKSSLVGFYDFVGL
jgi:hypothetical protein